MADSNQSGDVPGKDTGAASLEVEGPGPVDGSAGLAKELRKIYELRAEAEEQLSKAQAVRRNALNEAEALLAQAQRVAGSLESEARQTVVSSVSVARKEAEVIIAAAAADADEIVAEAKAELARAHMERSAADLALEDAKTIAFQQVEEARREADQVREQAAVDSKDTRDAAQVAASSLYSSVLGELELNAHVVSGSLDVASLAVREAFERIAAARSDMEAGKPLPQQAEEPTPIEATKDATPELPVLNALPSQGPPRDQVRKS